MLFDLMATVVAAFAAAGVALFMLRVLKIPFPKWIVPVAAGAAMIGYAIWAEYSWYGRMVAALPENVAVIEPAGQTSWWRPWSYAVPLRARFIAFDRDAVRTHPQMPQQRIVNVLLVGRWQGTVAVPVLYDCAAPRRADLVDGAAFADDGTVADAVWLKVPDDDPVRNAACEVG